MKYGHRILLVTLIIVTCGSSCQFIETEEEFYETFDQAMKAGAIGNWLPIWLPRSAVNIRERHRVDVPMAWIRFENAAKSTDDLIERCVDASVDELGNVSALKIDAPKWWPVELTYELIDAEGLDGWMLYRCNTDLAAVTEEDMTSVTYVWRLEGELASELEQ